MPEAFGPTKRFAFGSSSSSTDDRHRNRSARKEPRAPSSRALPVAPLVPGGGSPALEEGQRVSHAVFGAGVTASSSGGRTAVHFDLNGPKTFVTALLKLEVLSAPGTWETGPRGKNRPCATTP